jgi:NADH dehydrogenase
MHSSKKKIVILGGGFAGIYAALSTLRECGDMVEITVINRANYFLFTPLLHEVATGSLGHHQVVESIREIVYKTPIHFLEASIQSVDLAKKEVVTDHGTRPYDLLVVALGASTNFFGTPGAVEHSFVLKDLNDAIKIRNHVIERFEAASRESDPEVRKKILTFVVVGGGATGVEYAAELAEFAERTLYKYYKKECSSTPASITLVHAGPELLRPFTQKTQARALESLAKKGVTVLFGARVTEVSKDGVALVTGEHIDTETVIWTAGVRPNKVSTVGGEFEIDAHGRIMTDTTLLASGRTDVFAIGDVAHVADRNGVPYPMLAQIATKQAEHLGDNIRRVLASEPLESFSYTQKGSLVSLGKWEAAGNIGPVNLHGMFAWFVWRTVYLFKFISWSKRIKIAMDWTVNLFFPRDITRA